LINTRIGIRFGRTIVSVTGNFVFVPTFRVRVRVCVILIIVIAIVIFIYSDIRIPPLCVIFEVVLSLALQLSFEFFVGESEFVIDGDACKTLDDVVEGFELLVVLEVDLTLAF